MFRVLFAGAVTLCALIAIACDGSGGSLKQTKNSKTSPDSPVPPKNQCHSEGTSDLARKAAQGWCEDSPFSLVNVTADAHNFLIWLQLSDDGQTAWSDGDHSVRDEFRGTVNDLAVRTGMTVAFTLHDTHGQLLVGCTRQREKSEAACQ
jgi:hypothetical protein